MRRRSDTSLIAAVGEHHRQGRIQSEHGRQSIYAFVALLHIGWVNDRVHRQSGGVGYEMPLLLADFLARVALRAMSVR